MSFELMKNELPLIAILRGVLPSNVIGVTERIVEAGFKWVEVPLNSIDAIDSIRCLATHFGNEIIVGGGTVLRPEDVEAIAKAGGRFIVSPNCDKTVIATTKNLGLVSFPGVFTITEAFNALNAGADALKLFPADSIEPKTIKGFLSVLPSGTFLIPVGGVSSANMQDYIDAGAKGFGFGSNLYSPSFTLEEISSRANSIVKNYLLATTLESVDLDR